MQGTADHFCLKLFAKQRLLGRYDDSILLFIDIYTYLFVKFNDNIFFVIQPVHVK